MAQTDQLLDLMANFPDAFKEAQSTNINQVTVPASISKVGGVDDVLDPQLRQLMTEFPSAFIDPAADLAANANASESDTATLANATTYEQSKSSTEDSSTAIVSAQPTAASFVPMQLAQPGTYSQALKRQISTMTWGQIELYLTYGGGGLQSIWVTVGKSGTEVQSLCEAIARLINLLLAKQVPIPEIARQIRGIRGADSEGLGPNRILGLADLMGKVLQEAPTVLTPPTSDQGESAESALKYPEHGNGHNGNEAASTNILQAEVWTSIADHDHAASVCPECGAELHQVNGCSGGACVVCGYSSCS